MPKAFEKETRMRAREWTRTKSNFGEREFLTSLVKERSDRTERFREASMKRAILVGLGGRAKHWWGECGRHPGVDVVACVEPVEANRKRAVEIFPVAPEMIYQSLEEAAKEVDADLVVDVTPPSVHDKIALAAFEAGLHVFGEKPLSDRIEAARKMVEEGRRAGVRHMITQNYRFNTLPRTTRRILGESIIGKVAQLDVSLYVPWADNPGSHYVTEPYMFLTDMGVHHFDMIRYLMDGDPESVWAATWNLPWGWHKGDACQLILFRFGGGVMATHRGIGCTMGSVPAGHNGEWRFEGPEGTLTWEGFNLFLTRVHRKDPVVRDEIELDEVSADRQNPVLSEFLAALEEDREPECNAEDNLNSLKMVFAARKSAEEKREVGLEEI